MRPRALSLGLAGAAVAFAFVLATRSLSIFGPILYLPFFGAPVVGGFMALRAALMRRAGAPADPAARALEIVALGTMFAPGLGLLFVACSAGAIPTMCGVGSLADVTTVLSHAWPIGCIVELLAIGALVARGAGLFALPLHQAAATVLTLLVASPLAVVASVAAYTETDHGGASTVALVPAAIATGSTLVTWIRGRALRSALSLRRIVGAVTLVLVGVTTAAWEGRVTCRSFGTTGSWGLVSLRESGWTMLLVAGLLLFARDPRAID